MGNRLQEMEDNYRAKAAEQQQKVQDEIARLKAKSDAKHQADKEAKIERGGMPRYITLLRTI